MKKLVLVGLCVLCSLHAWAQSSLSGRIYDVKTAAPLVGASVWIESLGKGAVTDTDGKFTLVRVPNGRQEIRVSYVGYETDGSQWNFLWLPPLNWVWSPRIS
jgi:iron complex outermembrane receptor protein